ncbi:MAG: bifunctional pyr operon transcriptional regulator/uracil phosphoribosyltransferase PyrR [Sulfuricella sp.]|jgi:pyrimidine operon attenuation protein/uracil phosphoribosyltransferase|nr:bifunctional pyr operon transcriptional regulator/uracil phosphoribosyltransferase PyrR [Sulfuricella sp.]
MQLPDAEVLVREMAQKLKPFITERSALVGIHTGGVWLAEKLHSLLGQGMPMGTLDVSFYRDDFGQAGLHPNIEPSSIPFDVEGRTIILVDDVLYTGRSVRAAMNELFDYGRPASIILAVLVDRGGRELPIAAQVAGVRLDLKAQQNIQLNRDQQGVLSLSLHEKNQKN